MIEIVEAETEITEEAKQAPPIHLPAFHTDPKKAELKRARQEQMAHARKVREERIKQAKEAQEAEQNALANTAVEVASGDVPAKEASKKLTQMKTWALDFMKAYLYHPRRVQSLMAHFYERSLKNDNVMLRYMDYIMPKEQNTEGVTVIVQSNVAVEAQKGPRDLSGEILEAKVIK